MKAVGLTQPWASLVAIGAKRIETRSWSTNHRGPLAIHASKGFPRACMRLCLEHPFLDVLVPADLVGAGSLPRGAIVAVGTLRTCWSADEFAKLKKGWPGDPGLLPHELDFGDYSPGRFAWLLADVRRLKEPIPRKGALGLWTVPPEVACRLPGVA